MANSWNHSVDSFDSAEEDIHNAESTSALIVFAQSTEDTADALYFTDSDDNDGELDSSDTDWLASSSAPLSSMVVFLYLLSPFLTMGALLVPDTHIPLKLGILALCTFAGLSTFARYIWYMLSRYIRTTSMEQIIVHAIVRTPLREGRAEVLKYVVRLGDGLLRILLATMYLRSSVDVLRPISPGKVFLFPSRIYLAMVLATAIFPFSYASSLVSTRVKTSTALSLIAYISWLACTAYAHGTGALDVSAGRNQMGSLCYGITTFAFIFTASSTVSLYGSFKASHQHIRLKSGRHSKWFRVLLLLSALSAVAMIMPLLFFVSPPSATQSADDSIKIARVCLHGATLTLTIPSVLVQSPKIPMPLSIRRRTNLPISRFVTYAVVFLLSLLPSYVVPFLSNVLIVMALLGTYLLPAFIHIIEHNFRRPLTIVIPPQPSSLESGAIPASTSLEDELLQRKERNMQRRRFYRRLIWDLGAWILVLPIGGGGIVWAGGKLLSKW